MLCPKYENKIKEREKERDRERESVCVTVKNNPVKASIVPGQPNAFFQS